MAECRFCSAPVDRDQRFCGYCGSRVELDLHSGLSFRLYEPESERICPHCDIPLETIDLKIDKKFLIEKCPECSGLFFDPGELEMLIERSVSNVFHVDETKLNELQTKHFKARGKEFRYVKCPVCRTIMNRRAFGYKSGVIVDHCNKHGYWLDEGELRQLQEWKKAGGELRKKPPITEDQSNSGAEHRSRKQSDSSFSTSISRTDESFGAFDILDLFSSLLR